MAERGLDDYGSPILRMAVFRRLNPGAQVEFSVVPIGAAFPLGHLEYEGKATEAVKCEIIFPDGSYITAFKEMDKVERGKPVTQTPEQLAKDETKCLGRALRTAGIPQRLSELKILMQWITSMDGKPNISSPSVPPLTVHTVDNQFGTVPELLAEAFPGTEEVTDDSPDAGAEDPTPEQLLARQFAFLSGADKQAVVKYARETMDVGNVMRAGEHAEALMAYITGLIGPPDDIAAHDRKNEQRRAEASASIEPEEEVF